MKSKPRDSAEPQQAPHSGWAVWGDLDWGKVFRGSDVSNANTFYFAS